MITCITIDDEPLALRQLTSYIEKVPFLHLLRECSSPFEAMTVLAEQPVDLIFADINMPDLNGMDFIKSLTKRPMVIFTTAYSEYAIEGFRVDAVDYLLKPFGFNDFLKAANKAHKQMTLLSPQTAAATPTSPASNDKYIFVKSDYQMVRLDISNIKYIESQSEYVRIFMEEGKNIMTLLNMKSLEERLPADSFMRVHRSYIVNLKRIKAVAHNRIIYDKDTYIPVGNQYKEAFNAHLNRHLLGKV